MEALAEAGGICVSSAIYDAVDGKLDFGFDHLGEQQVKNVAKPVQVYRVRAEAREARLASVAPARRRRGVVIAASAVAVVLIAGGTIWALYPKPSPPELVTAKGAPTNDPSLALPKGPAIAVLPFENLSGDPKQDNFADTLTEELITALSRFQQLRTIGRHSTMQYKGQAVDVRQVGRDLGVDFAFEGSVRRDPKTLRITAQLIDARDGSHVWAETYDRTPTVENLFSVQDEVVERIVATVADRYGAIGRHLSKGSKANVPKDWEAYQCMALYYDWIDAATPETTRRLIDCAERATAADPGYADGWAFLAEAYAIASVYLGMDIGPDPLGRVLDAGLKAVQADPGSQQAHWALATAYFYRHELQSFKENANAALQLNPNSPYIVGCIGWLLWHSGEWDQGIALIEKAYKLNPQGPRWWLFPVAWNYFRLGDYEAALSVANRIKSTEYFDPLIHAAILGQLGRTSEAKAALDEAIARQPDLPERAREYLTPWLPDADLLERALDGLRKAGLDIPNEPTASN